MGRRSPTSGRRVVMLDPCYLRAEKKAYASSLAAAQKRLDYAPMIDFICGAISESEREMAATKQAIMALPQLWERRATLRAGSTARRGLSLLCARPIITVKILAQTLGVSVQAGNLAVQKFETSGIVRRRQKIGREFYYAAEEVIEILARPFDSDPVLALAAAQTLLKTPREAPSDLAASAIDHFYLLRSLQVSD